MSAPGDEGDRWVFGYGSLVWRPDFPFSERVPGWICGWGRRFWQGSTDHRGVPGKPGRVVTLTRAEGERCWGVAYRISGVVRERVFEHLDYREKGGYERHDLEVETQAGRLRALVYVGSPSNPAFLGAAPAGEIARQIAMSEGPSGTNREYLFKLANTLREVEEEDPHVFELDRLVRELVALSE